jgi:hypothetical protein
MKELKFWSLNQHITRVFVLTFCLVLASILANGQDLESLNKKELRVLCDERAKNIDSLQLAISLLFEKLQRSQEELSTKTDKIQNLEIEIKDNLENLNVLVRSGNEKDTLITKLSTRISMMDNERLKLHQQINSLQTYADSLNLVLNSSAQQMQLEQGSVDKSDWLEKLEFGSTSLPDGKFSFNLEGVIALNNMLGTLKLSQAAGFSQEIGLIFGPTPFVPELIPSNDLNFYFLKEESENEFNVLKSFTIKDFDSAMPDLEIMKGKIASFEFSDKTEENFFVSLMEIENNGIIQGQLNFAHEIATNSIQWGNDLNDAYKASKDLFYPVCEIYGRRYIVINHTQLIRLGLPISRASLYGPKLSDITSLEKLDHDWEAHVQAGDVFLSRDRTGSSPYFLAHNDCLFLFTLVPKE